MGHDRWGVTPDQKQAAINRLMNIIENPSSKTRDINAATRNLIAMESQNQKDELDQALRLIKRLVETAAHTLPGKDPAGNGQQPVLGNSQQDTQ